MVASAARAFKAGATEEDERGSVAGIFALVKFAQLAFRANGIDPVMSEIADSPSLFSGAFVNLDGSKRQLEEGGDWGLPAARVFRLPYAL